VGDISVLGTLFKRFGSTRYGRALISKFTTSAPWFWALVAKTPVVRNLVNRIFINAIAYSAPARPHPYSLWSAGKPDNTKPIPSGYTSWPSLIDRTFTNRQLGEASLAYSQNLPKEGLLKDLFRRSGGTVTPCTRSSALFGFFAQWLTDSFLRTDPADWRKNTSTHELDLCQIYGLTEADTTILRAHAGGLLASQKIKRIVGGLEFEEEYPPFLFEDDGKGGVRVCSAFAKLSYIDAKNNTFRDPGVRGALEKEPFNSPERFKRFFVAGLERGNSSIIYSALNTIFLREHNRLARAMAQDPSCQGWDDERLFQTARLANIAQYLRIIIEDYIAHISPTHFKMFVDVGWAEKEDWYRTNRISVEFNLLYRWHQLIPETLSDAVTDLDHKGFRFNNQVLVERGVDACIALASKQPAGAISLRNTTEFLVDADAGAVTKSRNWRLQSYQAYRRRFGMPPARDFYDLTGEKQPQKGQVDTTLAAKLSDLYSNDVDTVEYLIGLLAERRDARDVLPPLMTLMVGYDAFSHALTNPVLSERVYNEATFSKAGFASMRQVKTLADVLRGGRQADDLRCSFSCTRDLPGTYGPPLLKRIYDTADFFLRGWRRFLESRRDKFKSNVFRVNLFQPTIVALDHTAIRPLFDSPDLKQDYGFSWAKPPLDLVGGIPPSIFESGAAHDGPKSLYLAMADEATAALDKVYADISAEFLKKWSAAKIFSFRDEIEEFAIALIFQLFLGWRPKGTDARLIYLNIFNHVLGWFTRWLPWSTYAKSLRLYPTLVDGIKKAPKFAAIAAKAKALGLREDQDYVAHQIAFLLGMNSFLGTQNLLKSLVGELALHPELHSQLRDEFVAGGRGVVREGFVCETLRLHPPVFFIFGRATKSQMIQSSSGSFLVAPHELVMGAITLAHRDPDSFADPEKFDHTRYGSNKARERLIWPRGQHDRKVKSEDRMCPGKDLALLFADKFLRTLVESHWQLADQKVEWNQGMFTLNVAAPTGPLTTVSFKAPT
jgi:prostaglandin-endoperoxide synthase 2